MSQASIPGLRRQIALERMVSSDCYFRIPCNSANAPVWQGFGLRGIVLATVHKFLFLSDSFHHKLMNKILLSFLLLFAYCASAQKLPTIRATSKLVSIRDGDKFNKGAWTISPKLNPDVYTTSSVGKKVIFYTDKDSISVIITPNTKFNFVVLLNDTVANTQIVYKPSYLDVLKTVSKVRCER